MTYVVTDSYIKCKYTDCVPVCPTDAFRERPNFLAIDPDECIDCMLCVVECPVSAIFADCDIPPEHAHFIALNLELARIWKPIIEKRPRFLMLISGPPSKANLNCSNVDRY